MQATKVTTSPLSDTGLHFLRMMQGQAAVHNMRCEACLNQIWPNFCRSCELYFEDGHWECCGNYDGHRLHWKY
jgi:hypothetical protein